MWYGEGGGLTDIWTLQLIEIIGLGASPALVDSAAVLETILKDNRLGWLFWNTIKWVAGGGAGDGSVEAETL